MERSGRKPLTDQLKAAERLSNKAAEPRTDIGGLMLGA